MKIILTVLGLVLTGYLIYQVLPNNQPSFLGMETPQSNTSKSITLWFAAEAKELRLLDNTKKLISSIEVATSSGCVSGINAFYYDTNNQPLGWLVQNSEERNRFYKSMLLDGVVYTTENGFFIENKSPDKAVWGHQAGPLLIFKQQKLGANLDNKIADSRSVAIQTDQNKAVFAYFPEATLAQLPDLINGLGDKAGFTAISAINLDGGSSTSFWTGEARIYETLMSGGWWCKYELGKF